MTYESECLKAYLESWLEWVESGAMENQPYSCKTGLCFNILHWSGLKDAYESKSCAYAELRCSFNGCDYPFGEAEYFDGVQHYTMHLDQNRLTWVRNKIKELSTGE